MATKKPAPPPPAKKAGKKVVPIVALSPGAAALAKYREELAAATKKGPKALAAFKAERAKNKVKPAKNGGATPMQAIKQFCIHCVGDDQGTIRDIRDCTAPKCPLFHLRPYK
jgi:hypothetical protein